MNDEPFDQDDMEPWRDDFEPEEPWWRGWWKVAIIVAVCVGFWFYGTASALG